MTYLAINAMFASLGYSGVFSFVFRVKLKHFEKFNDTTEALAGLLELKY